MKKYDIEANKKYRIWIPIIVTTLSDNTWRGTYDRGHAEGNKGAESKDARNAGVWYFGGSRLLTKISSRDGCGKCDTTDIQALLATLGRYIVELYVPTNTWAGTSVAHILSRIILSATLRT